MKLRELLAKATPGPWVAFYKHKYNQWHVSIPIENSNLTRPLFDEGVGTENPEADAKLVAHLRNHAEAYVALEEAARPFTNYINKTTERIPTESDWLAFGKALRELEKP